jgi:hypothetical protein
MKSIDLAIRFIFKFMKGERRGKGLPWWLKALKESAWMICEGTFLINLRHPIKAIAVTAIPKWPIPRLRKEYLD